jgi:hypothetical protein
LVIPIILALGATTLMAAKATAEEALSHEAPAVTRGYAAQLVPLLDLNLAKLGKARPTAAVLENVAITLVQELEHRNVPLKGSSLSYAAFAWANSPAASGELPANVAAAGS